MRRKRERVRVRGFEVKGEAERKNNSARSSFQKPAMGDFLSL